MSNQQTFVFGNVTNVDGAQKRSEPSVGELQSQSNILSECCSIYTTQTCIRKSKRKKEKKTKYYLSIEQRVRKQSAKVVDIVASQRSKRKSTKTSTGINIKFGVRKKILKILKFKL